MTRIKRCECGQENSPSAFYCQKCQEDITRLPVIEDSDCPPIQHLTNPSPVLTGKDCFEPTDGKLSNMNYSVASPSNHLIFKTDDDQSFEVTDGEFVGRAKAGSDILQYYDTVSRIHIQVFMENGRWLIRNMSDNGTWLNGEIIAQGDCREISLGDELKLSSKCRLLVIV